MLEPPKLQKDDMTVVPRGILSSRAERKQKFNTRKEVKFNLDLNSNKSDRKSLLSSKSSRSTTHLGALQMGKVPFSFERATLSPLSPTSVISAKTLPQTLETERSNSIFSLNPKFKRLGLTRQTQITLRKNIG